MCVRLCVIGGVGCDEDGGGSGGGGVSCVQCLVGVNLGRMTIRIVGVDVDVGVVVGGGAVALRYVLAWCKLER